MDYYTFIIHAICRMKKEPRIKIFVAHHKPGYIYEDDIYVPIQVGKKNAKVDLGILGDDTGDNISEKNDNYAELTAQYWVWKNYDLSNVDYVGFCHYRRYLTYCYIPNIFNYIFAKNFYTKTENKNPYLRKLIAFKDHHCLKRFNKDILQKNSKKFVNYVEKSVYDIYMPKRNKCLIHILLKFFGIENSDSTDIISFGNYSYKNELIDECIKLFMKKYPEQKDIIGRMEEQGKLEEGYRRHLFVMKKELFFQYMKWLFDYLFELENLITEKNLDVKTHWAGAYDGRFMGIFSEPLINYWIEWMKEKYDINVDSSANTLMFTDYYI